MSGVSTDYNAVTTQLKNDFNHSGSVSTSSNNDTLNVSAVYEESEDGTITVDVDKLSLLNQQSDANLISIFRQTVSSTLIKQNSSLGNLLNTMLESNESLSSLKLSESATKAALDDIGSGGYWSTELTSDRLIEFAKTLSGNNTSKGSIILNALVDGYEDAKDKLGDGSISKLTAATYKAATSKAYSWLNGTESETTADS